MNRRILEIGFSPCPNDTFIFDAMVNGKIDTGNIEFKPVMEDVQTLNRFALEGKLPITKLSYGVLPIVAHTYDLLRSGSALGRGVGPLLISNSQKVDSIEDNVIAIPGEHTTAHFLLSHAYPETKHKVFVRYDEVEQFVLEGNGLGVIIHENRFTYQSKGLFKICDLGKVWEEQSGLPIPLGGIVIKSTIPHEVKVAVNDCIRRSLAWSYQQLPALSDMIKNNAREMEESVMRQHIDLYVNDFTDDLGEAGILAIREFERISALHNGEVKPVNILVTE